MCGEKKSGKKPEKTQSDEKVYFYFNTLIPAGIPAASHLE